MNDASVSTPATRHVPAPPPCPLDASRQELLHALTQGGNLVLSAQPGAGKSSRVPLWLLDQPWLAGRRILLLEPRRVAARALARYMASLWGEEPGGVVGYRMRDESRIGNRTRVEVVTEGVLTRMLQENAELPGIACVIFDEFHERSLVADTGLALCLESQAALRPDLRLIVMSATLDVRAVADLMGNCPVVCCEGRSFPVETRYLPPRLRAGQIVGGEASGPLPWRHMAAVIEHLLRTENGSLLAFLPGAGEIRRLAAMLEDALPPHTLLCPLYGNLSAREQDAAIAPPPPGLRKVVLATSIAETSLTIEGVRLVVDSGLARFARFDPASGLTSLVTQRVTLAEAAQRAGRAGRTEPGVCCRLWAREEENGMRPHTRPEIQDADLVGLALQLAVWGASDPADMPWLTPPPPAHLAVARQCLQTLGALDERLRPTARGRAMAALPLEPRTARLLLWGGENGHAPLASCLAALLEERDPLALARGRHDGTGAAAPGCDMRRRLDWLCRNDAVRAGTDGARERLRRQASRLSRLTSGHPKGDGAAHARQNTRTGTNDLFSLAAADMAALGGLLAFAWPEHVAMRQNDAQPQAGGKVPGGLVPLTPFLLRSGRAAGLPTDDPLSRQAFLAVAEVDGAGPRGRIRLAAALAREDVEELFGADIRIEDRLSVSDAGVVSARRQRVMGALILEDAPLPRPLPEQCVDSLCGHVRAKGLECLPWSDAARQWRARVALMRGLEGEAWPDVSDVALLANLHDWLAPALLRALAPGREPERGQNRSHSLAALSPSGLLEALAALLPGRLRRVLEQQAPVQWQAPSGSMRPIVYGDDGGPWLAVKLQEMFGCVEMPRIAGGRVALALHLNSPAGRPLQVTRDLANFWRAGYPAVRAEMRGRYPKHPWPEDPLAATATALTKKRLAQRQKN